MTDNEPTTVTNRQNYYHGPNTYTVSISCPHCGSPQEFKKVTTGDLELRYCDPETGGCEKPIMLHILSVSVSTEVYTLTQVPNPRPAQWEGTDCRSQL